MDFMTLIGLGCGLAMYAWGVVDGGSVKAFLNAHGIFLVVGGTLFATMIICPAQEFLAAMRAGWSLVFTPRVLGVEAAIELMCALGKKARQSGVDSLEPEIRAVRDDGFCLRAYRICLTSPDEVSARNVIEREIIQTGGRHRESGNVFKTLGMIAPMMGLMGTVIGIVGVLRNISDPNMVGSSMGVAMSTAFYGILFSGFIFTPMSGKLRFRSNIELLTKEIVMEGLLSIQFTDLPPKMLERGLLTYLSARSLASRAGGR